MTCRIIELRDKQVLSIKDGMVIGFVSDIEIDTECGKLTAILVCAKGRGSVFFGRNEDIKIPWEKIEVIGNDSILVNFEGYISPQRGKKGVLSGLFYGD